MSTTQYDPGQTETHETTPALQGISGLEATGVQGPQALWTQLRHEFRTPLDAIIGYSELLLKDADGLGQADLIANLNLINSAGQQLLEIIDDLLDTLLPQRRPQKSSKICRIDILRIDSAMKVMPKGVKKPLTIHEVGVSARPVYPGLWAVFCNL